MIAAVGGRLVPSFTRNELAQRGATDVPRPYGRYDVLVLTASFGALASWVMSPLGIAAAVLTGIAGILHFARLARWRGWLARRGDVLALQAGYIWVVAGFLLSAAGAFSGGAVPADAALHAWTAGAIGAMTLTVMARLAATRGAGRRANSSLSAAAIVLANLGAALRVGASLGLGDYGDLLIGAGTLWAFGLALFVLAQIAPGRCAAVAGK